MATVPFSRRRTRHQVMEQAQAALVNESITRQRVESLEECNRKVMLLLSRDFFGRLKWMLLGR